MEDFKEIAEKYARSNVDCDMRELTRMTNKFVEEVREKDPAHVGRFLCDLEMFICPFGSRKLAEKATMGLKNKDGTVGPHWKYEDVEEVARKHDISANEIPEFFFVLNMIYSDYAKNGRSVEEYVELALDFMDDKDAPEDKTTRYFRAMRY